MNDADLNENIAQHSEEVDGGGQHGKEQDLFYGDELHLDPRYISCFHHLPRRAGFRL